MISLRLHCVRWSLLPTEHIERASWGVQKQLLVERVDRCTFVSFFFFLFLLRRSRLLLEPISQFFFIIIKERALWLTPCSSFFFFSLFSFFWGKVLPLSETISAYPSPSLLVSTQCDHPLSFCVCKVFSLLWSRSPRSCWHADMAIALTHRHDTLPFFFFCCCSNSYSTYSETAAHGTLFRFLFFFFFNNFFFFFLIKYFFFNKF